MKLNIMPRVGDWTHAFGIVIESTEGLLSIIANSCSTFTILQNLQRTTAHDMAFYQSALS
jgi:hypothetical protein